MEPNAPAARTKMSTGAKVGIGCGVVAVLVVLLTCGGVIAGLFWGIGKLDEFAEEFENQGYVRVTGQTIPVDERVTEPTVFTGQTIDLREGSDASIAIAGQFGHIRGTVDGDVEFVGQVLTIHEGAVVTGDVHVRSAQHVNVMGEVRGELTGNWGSISGVDEDEDAPDDAIDEAGAVQETASEDQRPDGSDPTADP